MALRRTTNDERRTTKKFGKIGVLMGGSSSEREISLKSGKAVYEALERSGFEVIAIDIMTEGQDENIRLIKSHKVNCAFIALHGRFGEDGQIQQILEALEIPYTCSGVNASKLAMDKIVSREIFSGRGLNVPKYRVLDKRIESRQLDGRPDFPLVVKPATHGSSVGLSIVERGEDFSAAVESAFKFDERVIIEEYLKGRELTVGILEERSLPVIEIIPKNKFFDYEAKYHAGLTDYIVPAELGDGVAQKTQEAALSAHKLLGCSGCSRVDMILKDNLPYILEVNSIPGLTGLSLLPKAAKTAGIGFQDLCLKLLEMAHEKK